MEQDAPWEHAAVIGRATAEKRRRRSLLRAGGCRWQDTRCGRADAAGQDAHTQCRTVRSPQHCLSWGGGAVGRNAKCTCDTRLLLPSVRKALRTLNRGKICTSCMIRGVCAAKRAPSWQDIHVVYPPTAICRAFRIHGTHILPKPAHFEYTAAIYCHEEALFPSEAFFGMHRGKILPSSDTRERITSTYRHRQAPGNAFRGREAMPSAAGDTGCRANCAARVPMNPFTPTFSRCGTVIEFICYTTNE